jgi:hypothetical protein
MKTNLVETSIKTDDILDLTLKAKRTSNTMIVCSSERAYSAYKN